MSPRVSRSMQTTKTDIPCWSTKATIDPVRAAGKGAMRDGALRLLRSADSPLGVTLFYTLDLLKAINEPFYMSRSMKKFRN